MKGGEKMIASISTPSNQIQDTQMIQNQLATGTTGENKFLSVLEKLAGISQMKEENRVDSEPDGKAKKDGNDNSKAAAKDNTNFSKPDRQGLSEKIPALAGADGTDSFKEERDQIEIDFNSFILPAVIYQSISDQKTDMVSEDRTISRVGSSIGTKSAEKAVEDVFDSGTAMSKTVQKFSDSITGSLVSGVSKEELPTDDGRSFQFELNASISLTDGQTEKVSQNEQVVSGIAQRSSDKGGILHNQGVPPASFSKQDPISANNGLGMMPEGNKFFEKTFIETLGEKSLVQGNNQPSVDMQRELSETPKATIMADVLSASLKATDKTGLNIEGKTSKSRYLPNALDIASEGFMADNTNGLKVTVAVSVNTNTADTSDDLSDNRTSSSELLIQKKTSSEKDSSNSMPQELWGLAKADVTANRGVLAEKMSNVDPPEAYQQIYNQISNVIKDNNSTSLKMKLYPEGLGEISVTVNCQDNKLSLEIMTDNPLTQKLLQGQAEELKAALLTKNYEIPSLSICTKPETASSTFTATGDAPFSFFERNEGNCQYREDEVSANYDLSADYLSGEEIFIETSPQKFYFGNFSSWA